MNATTNPLDPLPMLSVCSYCKRQIVAGHIATGPVLAPAVNHSHGICEACLRGNFKAMGLSEANLKTILSHVTD